MLDQVQKGLSDYLETKRSVFARFYFLSNDELLGILSESKDVLRMQPHFKKCFEGIDKVEFEEDLSIVSVISPEGEKVPLLHPVDPKNKNVEVWLLEVRYLPVVYFLIFYPNLCLMFPLPPPLQLEKESRVSVRDVMYKAIQDYTLTPRTVWMQKWPGQCVLNGSQLHWTRETEDFIKEKGREGPRAMLELQVSVAALDEYCPLLC